MKFRAKQFACAIAVTGLAFAGINAAWAAAKPGGGFYTPYYSDASHSTMVGAFGISCSTGQPVSWGNTSAYPGAMVHTTCGGGWGLPPDPYEPMP